MLGSEAASSDKEGAEPTQQTASAHRGLPGNSLEQAFPRERTHSWVALDPLWVEGWALPVSQIVAPCTGMVEAPSVEI